MMQTAIALMIVGIAMGWFAHRMRHSVKTDVAACKGNCTCCQGKSAVTDYAKNHDELRDESNNRQR